MGVGFKGSALTAGGFESIDLNPDGDASTATVAVGSVGEHATSAKAFGNQFRVCIVVNEVAGGRHLGPGLPIGQIAARVGRSCIKLQRLKRQILEMGHVKKGSG